jgi:hypothetical protein
MTEDTANGQHSPHISIGGPLDTAALAHLGPLPKFVVVHVEPTAADSAPNTEIAEDLLFRID